MTQLREGLPPLPRRMTSLPLDSRGFPTPWFVEWRNGGVVCKPGEGEPDFRVMRHGAIATAHNKKLCWVCGQPRGVHGSFVIGPMCAINRTSAEPPSHHDCATFSALACPFLTKPRMRRNLNGLEDRKVAGFMIERNPGVTLIWTTKSYRPYRVDNGVLFQIGEPERLEWFAEGRTATREEIMASITSGLPLLEEAAVSEGPAAVAAFKQYVARGMKLVPQETAA